MEDRKLTRQEKWRAKQDVKRLQFAFYEKDHDLYYKFMSVKGKTQNDKLRNLLKNENDFNLFQDVEN